MTLSYFNDSIDIEKATLQLLAHAKKTIFLETYIYEDDGYALAIRDLLIEKAKGGVRVILLLDAYGATVDSNFFSALIKHGGEVIFFRPLRFTFALLSHLRQYPKRNHRKLLLVDDTYGIISSKNIDTKNWKECGLLFEGDNTLLRKNFLIDVHTAKHHYSIESLKYRRKFEKRVSVNTHHIIYSKPRFRERTIRNQYLKLIKNAKEEIIIMHSYFLPDQLLRHALYKAAKQGIRIHIILPKKGDHPCFNYAAGRLFSKLIRKGIHIYYYTEKILHSKLMLIDGKTYFLGSSNMDHLSFHFLYEANILGSDQKIAKTIHQNLMQDMAGCENFDLKKWKTRGWKRKLIGWFLFRIRYVL